MTDKPVGGAAVPAPCLAASVADDPSASWRAAHTRYFLLAIAKALPTITDAESFNKLAQSIRAYFERPANFSEDDLGTANLERLLPTFSRLAPAMSAKSWAAELQAVELPTVEHHCPVGRSFERIARSLHLTRAERTWLLLTYCMHRDRSMTLTFVMLHLDDEAAEQERWELGGSLIRKLAAVLSVTAEEAVELFRAPCRMRGLGLMDTAAAPQRRDLGRYFDITEPILAVLDSDELDDEQLLDRLRSPAPPWFIDPRHGTPSAVVQEWFPPPLADMLIDSMHGRELTAAQLATCIEWCSGCTVQARVCEPLVGWTTKHDIRQAIARYSVDCSVSEQPFTADGVWRAVAADRKPPSL